MEVYGTISAGQQTGISLLFIGALALGWLTSPSNRRLLSSSIYIYILSMTSKELLGTSYYAVNSEVTMKIPVAESYLPVQNIKAPYQDLSKDLVYSNDVRNVHFEMKLTCSDGLNESEEKFLFDKDTMNSFFQQIQKIQDEMNSYM